jgi:hypothetical protein
MTTDIKRNDETDGNYDKLHWQRHCKVIRVHELYSDGMQKKREKCFSSISCFCFFLFSSSSSSKAVIKATHYMTVSSKTHKPKF